MPISTINKPLASKINWTQIVGIVVQVIAFFGIDVPPEVSAQIAIGIAAVQSIATWVFRTWFTG